MNEHIPAGETMTTRFQMKQREEELTAPCVTLQPEGEQRNLAKLLAAAGYPLDLRCGGNGVCGRCRVKLRTGEWETDGKTVTAPAEVNACRTRLVSARGTVDVPEQSTAAERGRTVTAWRGRQLPENGETVIAVDIGTTTIAAVKLRGNQVIREASCFNSQNRFGDNVITRISQAGASLEALESMRHAAVASINELLDQLDASNAVRIAVAGNTAMSCFLHGVDPSPIGVMPFEPPRRIFPIRSATELGLRAGEIPVLTVPAIAGYIGGDLTAGLFETTLRPGELFVDIGTNCEIILRSPTGFFCTSAAAGPAFEGAGIHCGCRAIPGAIDHYFGNGSFSMIGTGNTPVGLCGSAMIDFLAVERKLGHLNEFGRIQPPADSFEAVPGISICEREIEQLLKAKAAVRAGIRTLADHCGIPIQKIYLAGGFAHYLDFANAVGCGMLPAECEFEAVGNTSLGGAAHLALDPSAADELEKLIDIPEEIPLNLLPEFKDNYIDDLLLP